MNLYILIWKRCYAKPNTILLKKKIYRNIGKVKTMENLYFDLYGSTYILW